MGSILVNPSEIKKREIEMSLEKSIEEFSKAAKDGKTVMPIPKKDAYGGRK
jgi:hypothetical protein